MLSLFKTLNVLLHELNMIDNLYLYNTLNVQILNLSCKKNKFTVKYFKVNKTKKLYRSKIQISINNESSIQIFN